MVAGWPADAARRAVRPGPFTSARRASDPACRCRLLHTTTHHPRPRDRGVLVAAAAPPHRTRTPPPRWRSASAVTVPCNIKKKSGRRSRRGRRRQRQAAASRSRPGAPRADTCAPSDVASVHRPLYSYVVVDGVASACSHAHAPPPDRTGDWTRVGSLARVPDGVGSEYDTPGHGMYMSRRHCTRHDHTQGDSRVFICLRVRTPLSSGRVTYELMLLLLLARRELASIATVWSTLCVSYPLIHLDSDTYSSSVRCVPILHR